VPVHVADFELHAGDGCGDEAAIRTLIRSFSRGEGEVDVEEYH